MIAVSDGNFCSVRMLVFIQLYVIHSIIIYCIILYCVAVTIMVTYKYLAGSKEMRLRNESLPPCLNCGRADCFVIGSHDFSKEIAAKSG